MKTVQEICGPIQSEADSFVRHSNFRQRQLCAFHCIECLQTIESSRGIRPYALGAEFFRHTSTN